MTVHIRACRLIPGEGGPIREGVVAIDGADIIFAGSASDAPQGQGAQVTEADTVCLGCGTATPISWVWRRES